MSFFNEKIYIPFELKRILQLLNIEVILTILSFLASAVLITIYSPNFDSNTEKWLLGFLFLVYLIGPFVLFFPLQRIILLLKDSNIDSFKELKKESYIRFVFLCLIVAVLGLLSSNFFAVHILPILILLVLNILFFILKLSAIHKANQTTILWNQPDNKKFFKGLTFDRWIQMNVKSLIQFSVFYLLFFLQLTVMLGWFAKKSSLNADLLALLPPSFQSVKGLNEVSEVFGGFGYLMLAIETDEYVKEREAFEKNNNVKILDEYKTDEKGNFVYLPRIDKDGNIIGMDEKLVLKSYYLDKENSDKKIRWEADIPKTKLFVERVAAELEKLEQVSYCTYGMPIDFFLDNMALYSDLRDLATIYARAKKKKRDVFLDKIGLKISLEKQSVTGIDISDIEERLNKDSGSYISKDGFYLSGNNKMMGVLIKPSQPSTKISFCKELYNKTREVVESTKAKMIESGEFHPGIKIGYGGRYKRKPDGQAIVEKDLKVTSFLGLLFIVGIVTLYFKRYSALLLITVPLVIGVIWTYGFTFLWLDYINILTGFLTVILFGLGVDFGIHFLSRFFEEKEKGKSLADSVYIMLSKTGKATLTAVITTIVSFIALMFTEFKGFYEFGFIGFIGLFMAYMSMFYVLTLILIFSEKLKGFFRIFAKLFENKIIASIIFALMGLVMVLNIYYLITYIIYYEPASIFYIPVYYFIIPYLILLKLLMMFIEWVKSKTYGNRFIEKAYKKPSYIIYAFIILTIGSILLSDYVYFEYNFRKLEGMNLPSFLIEDKISKQFNLSLSPSVVIAHDGKEDREIYNAYYKVLEKGGAKTTLETVDALSFWVPEAQTEKMELIGDIRKIIQEFKERGQEEEFQNDAEVQKSISQLEKWEKDYHLNDVDFVYPEMIPDDIIRMYKANPDDNKRAVLIFPFQGVGSNGKKVKQFANEVRGIELKDRWLDIETYSTRKKMPLEEIHRKIADKSLKSKKEDNKTWIFDENRTISAAGENLILADILFLVEHDAPFIVISVLLLTMIVVFVDLRTIRKTIIVLLPLSVGMALMFGFMAVFDIQFNILNVVIFPVIIGIGVDSSVHIYHRYLDEGPGSMFKVMNTTGLAVTFAALTTILGFGALTFANHNGLNSIGSFAVAGIAANFIAAIILLPALLLFLERYNLNDVLAKLKSWYGYLSFKSKK